jgi:hypothetical protein
MFCPAPVVPLLATTYNLAKSNLIEQGSQVLPGSVHEKISFAFLIACLSFPSIGSAQKSDSAPNPPTIPVSQIHAGMRGVAYTVFEGVKPEAMEVEVLGVLHNVNGPKGDVILVRLHGQKVEYTGVVAGMSGSPVYLDGKLAGALAFRIGEFSKEPIAGVTPIADMLEINALDRSPAEESAAVKPSLNNVAGKTRERRAKFPRCRVRRKMPRKRFRELSEADRNPAGVQRILRTSHSALCRAAGIGWNRAGDGRGIGQRR